MSGTCVSNEREGGLSAFFNIRKVQEEGQDARTTR